MVLKTDNFEIYSYDSNDNDQRHLKYVLNRDEKFKHYITKKLDERLNESITNEEFLQYEHSYFIKYKNDFVGYVRLEKLKKDGSLDIQIAVSEEYRNQKLGSKILEEVSSYILNNINEVSRLRGVINKNNYESKNMFLNNGYSIEDIDEEYIYVSKSK